MNSLVPMEAVRTVQSSSPLGEFLRRRLEQILARWEAGEGPAASAAGKAALWRFLAAVDELGAAVDGLLEPAGARSERAAGCRVMLLGEAPPLAADLAKLLESSGEVVAKAFTADEAVQTAVEGAPDVVVGWGAASYAAVRAIRECLPGVPVVVAIANRADAAGLTEAFATDPVILLGPEAGAAEIAMAARALAELGGPRDVHVAPGEGQEGSGEITDDPRSYPHLAGLLPRALERAIDFDVGAGVVARPGTEPLVDVYARSDCSDETLGRVREHALALFRLVAGGAARVEVFSRTAQRAATLCSELGARPVDTPGGSSMRMRSGGRRSGPSSSTRSSGRTVTASVFPLAKPTATFRLPRIHAASDGRYTWRTSAQRPPPSVTMRSTSLRSTCRMPPNY